MKIGLCSVPLQWRGLWLLVLEGLSGLSFRVPFGYNRTQSATRLLVDWQIGNLTLYVLIGLNDVPRSRES